MKSAVRAMITGLGIDTSMSGRRFAGSTPETGEAPVLT